MEKISSKQITGVVDLNSNQSISGRKDFLGGLTSSAGPTGHIPLIQDGYIYFVRNTNQVADGDFRLGVSSLSGLFCLQQLTSGLWSNVCLDGCTGSTATGGGGTGGGTGGGDLGGGGGCLLYGTLVTLADGSTKLIEELELGDLVKTVSIEGLDSEVEDAWKTFTSSSFGGSYVVSRALFEGTLNNLFDTNIYVRLADGANSEQVYAALTKATTDKGLGKLQSRDEFIDAESGQINQILGLIYGLLGLSIIIAIVGIVITLLLSVFERRREIGLLRAIGMTRSQVRTTVRWESVITSMFGAIVGVVLGVVMGFVLILILADSGAAAFSLPIAGTIWILVLSFIVGVLAAVYPARRATKVDIMQSIATT